MGGIGRWRKVACGEIWHCWHLFAGAIAKVPRQKGSVEGNGNVRSQGGKLGRLGSGNWVLAYGEAWHYLCIILLGRVLKSLGRREVQRGMET